MLKVSFIYIIHLILLSQVFATEASHVLLGKDAAVKCEVSEFFYPQTLFNQCELNWSNYVNFTS